MGRYATLSTSTNLPGATLYSEITGGGLGLGGAEDICTMWERRAEMVKFISNVHLENASWSANPHPPAILE